MVRPVARERVHGPARRGEVVTTTSGTEVEVIEPQRTGVKPLSAGRKAIQAFKIVPVKPVGLRKINMMIYGPYGHGKTTFATSSVDVPSMNDVLFINAESGDMSITNRRSLDIIDISNYDQLARIFEYLSLHCKWRDEGNWDKLLEYEMELKNTIVDEADQTPPTDPMRTWFEEQRLRTGKPMNEPYLYRTVILDSLSELHKYLVYKWTGVNIGTTKLDEEIEKMENWQQAQEQFRLLIRSFRNLPVNTIFVSAEAIEPNERNKKKNPHAGQSLPKLAGQMAGDVAGFIDIVGYFYREIEPGGDTHRYLYLGAGYEGWISKHRFENLPDLEYVHDHHLNGRCGPTLTSILDLARKDAEHGSSSEGTSAKRRAIAPTGHTASADTAHTSRPASHAPAGSSRSGPGRDRLRRRAGR